MTVGIVAFMSGVSVPSVRSTGPTPTIPSTPSKSAYSSASPIDWLVITRLGARVTWSRSVYC